MTASSGSQATERAERVLGRLLAPRLDARARDWLAARTAALEAAANGPRADLSRAFTEALAVASRFAPRGKLSPDELGRAAAADACEGWNPERWTILEAMRVALVLALARAADDALAEVLEESFRYADEGELCALYRSLQLLPDGARFGWRSGEGCRTNMLTVFQANACDTGFPARRFDPIAWRQMCLKAVFVGAPLWRVYGVDQRGDSELTRMALDAAEERRSAGRPISPELWLCVGRHEPERARRVLAAEISGGSSAGRAAATLALGRLGERAELERLLSAGDPVVASAAADALAGRTTQAAFRAFREDER